MRLSPCKLPSLSTSNPQHEPLPHCTPESAETVGHTTTKTLSRILWLVYTSQRTLQRSLCSILHDVVVSWSACGDHQCSKRGESFSSQGSYLYYKMGISWHFFGLICGGTVLLAALVIRSEACEATSIYNSMEWYTVYDSLRCPELHIYVGSSIWMFHPTFYSLSYWLLIVNL